MGFWSKLRERLGRGMRDFERQVEGYGLPADGARPAPAPRPAQPVRPVQPPRRPAAATPPRAPRHRLEPDRRRRDDNEATDYIPGLPVESATPHWIDVPGAHDHRHHGHAVEHDSGSRHHGGHDHGSSWSSAPDTSHHSGGHDHGSGGGGHDGGSSCGSGGGD
jgi:hypothetical protein